MAKKQTITTYFDMGIEDIEFGFFGGFTKFIRTRGTGPPASAGPSPHGQAPAPMSFLRRRSLLPEHCISHGLRGRAARALQTRTARGGGRSARSPRSCGTRGWLRPREAGGEGRHADFDRLDCRPASDWPGGGGTGCPGPRPSGLRPGPREALRAPLDAPRHPGARRAGPRRAARRGDGPARPQRRRARPRRSSSSSACSSPRAGRPG